MSYKKYNLRNGFTLVEILVVVLILGILVRMIVISFSNTDQEQAFRGYAEQLALRIEAARDRALQHNKEWGVYIDADGLRFAEFDELNVSWVEQSQRPFHHDAYSETLDFDVEVEAFEGSLVDDGTTNEDNDLPTIVLFSSGETTPFTLSMTPKEWETRPWQLSSDGFSRTLIERVEPF